MAEFEFNESEHQKELDYIRKLLEAEQQERRQDLPSKVVAGLTVDVSAADLAAQQRAYEEYYRNLERLELEQPELKDIVYEGGQTMELGPFTGCSYTCPSCVPLNPVYTTNTLNLFNQFTLVEGDFLVSGVGTRDTGYGTLTINPPTGATILYAWLYWNIFATEPVDVTQVTFSGMAVTGTKIGEVGNTCWPCDTPAPIPSNTPIPCPDPAYTQLKNRVYRADVGPTGVNIVNGTGGSYGISGLPYTAGTSVCTSCPEPTYFPGCCGSQGAVLLIVYQWTSPLFGPTDHAQRFRQITIYDGAVTLRPDSLSACYPGVATQNYSFTTPPTQYILFPTVAFAAGDTQSYPSDKTFNSTDLSSFGPPNAGNLLAVSRYGFNASPPLLGAAPVNTVTGTATVDCVNWFLWAMSAGDPHFYGFEGDRFDVHGEPDKYYCLFSDKNIQINSLFKEWDKGSSWTSMSQISIQIGNLATNYTKILVDIESGATVNGVELDSFYFFKTGIGRNIGSVEVMDEWPTDFEDCRDLDGFGDFLKGYKLRVEDYEFIVAICTDGYHGYYLNFLGKAVNPEARPHGIVGQTLDGDGKPRMGHGGQGEGAIEGHYKDYEVSNLWSNDFRYGLYNAGSKVWFNP